MGKGRNKKPPNVGEPPVGGIVGGGGSGWSGKILRRLTAVINWLIGAGQPVAYEPGFDIGANDLAQTSENHEAGLWGTEGLRAILAMLAGMKTAVEDWRTARAALVDKYLHRELTLGLGGHECLVPDSHTHQHLAGVIAARIAAVLSQDARLLELTLDLMLRWARAGRALCVPGTLFIGSAGFRSPHQPLWWSWSAFNRQLAGLRGPMPEFERNPDNWLDPMNAPIRGLRWLQGEWTEDDRKRGLTSSPAGTPRDAAMVALATAKPSGCILEHEMRVYRREGIGHLVVIPPVAGKPGGGPGNEVADWCYVPHAGRDFRGFNAGVTFGQDWRTKPPPPPKGAELIVFPASGT